MITRRQSFQSAAALAGLSLLADVRAAENPAEDRFTTLKLTSLRPMPVGSKVYLKLETNHGIVGWGEVTGSEPTSACALATSLFELLDKENPTRVEHLWQKLYRAHRDMRGGTLFLNVQSAIDMALWDIAGKLHKVPVHRLLGGPTRDKIRVYPDAKSFKMGPAHGLTNWAGTPKAIEEQVREVARWRERLGPDGLLMFDAHSAMPPATLIQFANAIKPYDLLFIEEPAAPGNVEVFKRIKAAVSVPLATGERDRTIWGVLPYLQHNCIDILQPDCGMTGGISQMRKIATLAEAWTVPLAPHCTMSELGLSASLNVAAAIPHLLIHEAYLDGHIMPAGVARKSFEVDKEGFATPPA
jgi:galactonate dehydratase